MTRLSLGIGALAELAVLVPVLDALGAPLGVALPAAFLLTSSSVALVVLARRGASTSPIPVRPGLEALSNAIFVAVGVFLAITGDRELLRACGLAAAVAGIAGTALAWQTRLRLRRGLPGAKL